MEPRESLLIVGRIHNRDILPLFPFPPSNQSTSPLLCQIPGVFFCYECVFLNTELQSAQSVQCYLHLSDLGRATWYWIPNWELFPLEEHLAGSQHSPAACGSLAREGCVSFHVSFRVSMSISVLIVLFRQPC